MKKYTLNNATAIVGVALAFSLVVSTLHGNSSICNIGSNDVGMVRHYTKENNNSSLTKTLPKRYWQDYATEIFLNSRPFTKEEARAHENMLKRIGNVIVRKAFRV